MREAKSDRNGPKYSPLKTRAQFNWDNDRKELASSGTFLAVAFWALVGLYSGLFEGDWLQGLLAFALAHLVQIGAGVRQIAKASSPTVEAISVQDARRERLRDRSQRRTRCLEAMAVGARVGDRELHRAALEELNAIGSEVEEEAMDHLNRVL